MFTVGKLGAYTSLNALELYSNVYQMRGWR